MHIQGWKLERVQFSGFSGQQRTEKTGVGLSDELDSGPRGGLGVETCLPRRSLVPHRQDVHGVGVRLSVFVGIALRTTLNARNRNVSPMIIL